MKVAVVSDIHSNRQAFEAVLEAVADSDASELWCLGDIVGYGADPDACVELARRHVAVCLAGNHDMAVVGELPLDEFSRGASIAAQWTREVIAPANLRSSPACDPRARRPRGPIGLYHASPRDPVWEYVLSALLAELCLDREPNRICLIGHSHVASSFTRQEGEAATGEPCREGTELDLVKRRMDAQSRERRATARRRPPRRVVAAGPGRVRKLPTGAPAMTSPAPPRRSRQRVCQTRLRSAWSTVSEHANTHTPCRGGAARRRHRPAGVLRKLRQRA